MLMFSIMIFLAVIAYFILGILTVYYSHVQCLVIVQNLVGRNIRFLYNIDLRNCRLYTCDNKSYDYVVDHTQLIFNDIWS